jgi:5-hydroxyisourate hydrolase-like protein (transthyretin family)
MRLFYALLLCSACSVAQPVEGNVLNSVTGRGIAGVKVTLSRANYTFYSSTTDTQGHFLFEQVQDGSYTVSYASADYFYEPKGPRQIQVAAAANPIKLEARMTPLARLSGRVVDGRGHAVPGAGVQIAGPRRSMASHTDANGRFELRDNLLPDAYTVSVVPPPDLKPPDPEPDSDPVSNWTRTYYPGVTTPEAASKITLLPGSEVSDLELKLLAVPAHSVRGVLVNHEGEPVTKVAISLNDDLALASTESRRDGSFEFPAVVDGEWRLSAELTSAGVKQRATQWIEMNGHQLDGVKLQLNPPFTVPGRVLVETAQGARSPRMPEVALDPHVSRSHRDNGILIGLASTSPNARPDADGNLKLENVYTGAYRIIAMNPPAGYYLDSVRVGDAEQSTLEVELSSGAVPITLLYKANGGTVRGTAEKCASGGVALVPQDPALRRPGFLYSKPCDSNDRYEIGNVRPGDYYLAAFPGDGPDPWFRAKLDDTILNQAIRVSVRAGETSPVDLRAITPPRY